MAKKPEHSHTFEKKEKPEKGEEECLCGFKPEGMQLFADESETTVLRCALPDSFALAAGAKCKWPMKTVTTSHRLAGLDPLSTEEEHRAWLDALRLWNEACGINLVYQEDHSTSNIFADPGSMGSGTLAWSYLPCNASKNSRMEQEYNKSVRWSYALLMDTIAHEVGHAIGWPHNTEDSKSIMRPYSNGQLGKLSQSDIKLARDTYGPPSEIIPQPPDPVPGGLTGNITVMGKKFFIFGVPL